MRKFPKAPNNWFNRSNVLSFFLAWNAFGILLYRFINRKEKGDPEIDSLSFKQKYLQVISGGDNEAKYRHYKMKGAHIGERVDTTLGELLQPTGESEKTGNETEMTELQNDLPPAQFTQSS